MTIAAIATTYRDIRFRSRLEAKWAAFFDNVGLPWSYEAVDMPGWIPDFRLGDLLVEIKPARARPQEACDKAERAGVKPGQAYVFGEQPAVFEPMPFLRRLGWCALRPEAVLVLGFCGMRGKEPSLSWVGVADGIWPWPDASMLDSGARIDRAWAHACNTTQWRAPT